jgi:hypothetical protein
MTCPVKQKRRALGSNNTHTSTLTSRSFPVRVTSAIAASQTRQQNAGDPQGPGIRPLSEFVGLLNSVTSGRLYSES